MQIKGVMYSSKEDDGSYIITNHKNAVRDTIKKVGDEFKRNLGLQSKVKIENLEKIDPEDAGWDEEDSYKPNGDRKPLRLLSNCDHCLNVWEEALGKSQFVGRWPMNWFILLSLVPKTINKPRSPLRLLCFHGIKKRKPLSMG